MALIKCPNCNGEISDQSCNCIHCGYIISNNNTITCKECGCPISKEDKICNNCGCPIKKSKAKKIIIITICIFVVAIISSVIINSLINEKKKADEEKKEQELIQYKEKINLTANKILTYAVDAENCGNTIKSIWYNTIYEKSDDKTDKYTKDSYRYFNDDFNTSLNKYFADSPYIELVNNIEENQKTINNAINELSNPPEEMKEAYADLKQLYNDYIALNNYCTNPQGNLTSYSTGFSDADSKVSNDYNIMRRYAEN